MSANGSVFHHRAQSQGTERTKKWRQKTSLFFILCLHHSLLPVCLFLHILPSLFPLQCNDEKLTEQSLSGKRRLVDNEGYSYSGTVTEWCLYCQPRYTQCQSHTYSFLCTTSINMNQRSICKHAQIQTTTQFIQSDNNKCGSAQKWNSQQIFIFRVEEEEGGLGWRDPAVSCCCVPGWTSRKYWDLYQHFSLNSLKQGGFEERREGAVLHLGVFSK